MLIGYARCSTKEQNTDMQVAALQQAGCEKLFVERASGTDRERPQLAVALQAMRSGDTIVVWKLDRLARSLVHLVEIVAGLDAAGCNFRSLTEAISTETAGGRLVFHIFGALAEFERELIRERVSSGVAAYRERNGGKWGRPRQYANRDVAAQIAALRATGVTTDKAISKLGLARATAYREMRRQA